MEGFGASLTTPAIVGYDRQQSAEAKIRNRILGKGWGYFSRNAGSSEIKARYRWYQRQR
jgi:hypothetical protein